jgi:Zn-dependent protease
MTKGSDPSGADGAGHGVRIARVGGVPVYLAPSWFVIALVIVVLVGPPMAQARPDLGVLAYAYGLVQAVMLLVSVLAHEGAHAAVARAFGMPVVRIVANLWGGHTSMEAVRSSPGRMALVAIAGPAANALFAGLAFAVAPAVHGDIPGRVVEGLVIINASLAVLNILPGMPLDGGQVVECLVWKATGDRNRGAVVAGWCGRVLTVLLVLWFAVKPLLEGGSLGYDTIWVVLIATVLWSGATASIRRGQALARVGRIRLADVLRPASAVSATMTAEEAMHLGGREVVVMDADGRLAAYVDVAHLAAVPAQVRSQTPLSAVASRQHERWVIDADPDGDVLEALTAMQRFGIPRGAVVHDGRLLGVVHVGDIGEALSRN